MMSPIAVLSTSFPVSLILLEGGDAVEPNHNLLEEAMWPYRRHGV